MPRALEYVRGSRVTVTRSRYRVTAQNGRSAYIRRAIGSVRFSVGRATSEGDVAALLEVLPGVIEQLRAVTPAYRVG